MFPKPCGLPIGSPNIENNNGDGLNYETPRMIRVPDIPGHIYQNSSMMDLSNGGRIASSSSRLLDRQSEHLDFAGNGSNLPEVCSTEEYYPTQGQRYTIPLNTNPIYISGYDDAEEKRSSPGPQRLRPCKDRYFENEMCRYAMQEVKRLEGLNIRYINDTLTFGNVKVTKLEIMMALNSILEINNAINEKMVVLAFGAKSDDTSNAVVEKNVETLVKMFISFGGSKIVFNGTYNENPFENGKEKYEALIDAKKANKKKIMEEKITMPLQKPLPLAVKVATKMCKKGNYPFRNKRMPERATPYNYENMEDEEGTKTGVHVGSTNCSDNNSCEAVDYGTSQTSEDTPPTRAASASDVNEEVGSASYSNENSGGSVDCISLSSVETPPTRPVSRSDFSLEVEPDANATTIILPDVLDNQAMACAIPEVSGAVKTANDESGITSGWDAEVTYITNIRVPSQVQEVADIHPSNKAEHPNFESLEDVQVGSTNCSDNNSCEAVDYGTSQTSEDTPPTRAASASDVNEEVGSASYSNKNSGGSVDCISLSSVETPPTRPVSRSDFSLEVEPDENATTIIFPDVLDNQAMACAIPEVSATVKTANHESGITSGLDAEVTYITNIRVPSQVQEVADIHPSNKAENPNFESLEELNANSEDEFNGLEPSSFSPSRRMSPRLTPSTLPRVDQTSSDSIYQPPCFMLKRHKTTSTEALMASSHSIAKATSSIDVYGESESSARPNSFLSKLFKTFMGRKPKKEKKAEDEGTELADLGSTMRKEERQNAKLQDKTDPKLEGKEERQNLEKGIEFMRAFKKAHPEADVCYLGVYGEYKKDKYGRNIAPTETSKSSPHL